VWSSSRTLYHKKLGRNPFSRNHISVCDVLRGLLPWDRSLSRLDTANFHYLRTTNKMHRYTVFFIMSMLYMFRAVSAPIIRSSKTVHTASGICQACLLLPLAWVSWKVNFNKMQRYTIFFIIVNALHVSGGFCAHHQELKNCTHSLGYMSSLLAATVSELELTFQLTHASGRSKQA